MWYILTFAPMNNSFAVQMSKRIAAAAKVNRASGFGYRAKMYQLKELLRLVGSITPMPFP